jgi:hypothetical protein
MRVAIVGSRDFPSEQRVRAYVDALFEEGDDPSLRPVIVSGGARGVDSWACQAALARGWEVDVHPADWDTYGKSAGYRRNQDIVLSSDLVVAFWDGKSKGTRHSIDLALRYLVPLEVIFP